MTVRVVCSLSPAELAQINATIAAATDADDRSPVSEETLLHLRTPERGHRVQHVLAELDDQVVGYGVLIPTEGPQRSVAELAVAPAHRGRGIGHAIVGALLELVEPGDLRLWAHGRDAHAAALARSMGFDRQRTLLQMRRSLTSRLPAAVLPADFTLRTFRPGLDDQAFLAANAAAFVDLPDQGGWTQADLAARLQEPWFDASGFFLLLDPQDRLAGFHWTKMHPPEPLGEVYVLGVVPWFQGRGLAAGLAQCGLRHLRSAGATTAMLYVDEANASAVRLYQRLGFSVWDVDVLYTRPASAEV